MQNLLNAEKEKPSCLLVGMPAGAATLENSIEVPHNVKNRASYRTTRHLFKGDKHSDLKGHMHPNAKDEVIYI